MKQTAKRALALLLAFALCVSMMQGAVLAAEVDSVPTEPEAAAEEPVTEPEAAAEESVTEPEAAAEESVTEPEAAAEEESDAEPVAPEEEAAIVGSGTCGENLTWVLTDDGTLTISGTGAMTDWSSTDAPWYSNRSSITSVIIEDGVTSIGSYAFYYCRSLTSVMIPDGVTSIGSYSFYSCESLTSVTIPDGVTSIGSYAFGWCESLTSVTIPGSVTSIGAYAFTGTPWLENQGDFAIVNGILFEYQGSDSVVTIPDGVTSIGGSAFKNCTSLTSVTIPDGVTSIGEDAFSSCSNLTSVTIPNSVTDIGYWAFAGTPWLENQGDFALANGILMQYQGADSAVIIPDSVTSISSRAFVTGIAYGSLVGCSSLTSVTIPSSVASIGSEAFGGCDQLNTVYFEGSAPEGDSVFPDIEATAYYNIDDTWTEEAQSRIGNKLNWMPVRIECEVYTYVIGSGEDVTIWCSGALEDFVCVKMDGELVDPSNYTLASGSTLLTLKSSYLDTLSVGEHKVEMTYFINGRSYTVETTLNVLDRTSSTNTGASGGGSSTEPSNSQYASISVQIVDENNQPLAGYTVEIHSTPKTATTNKKGVASFSKVAVGEYTLYLKDNAGTTLAAKGLKVLSGSKLSMDGKVYSAQSGASIAITIRYNGDGTATVIAGGSGTAAPKTGDEQNPVLWGGLLLCAAVGLCGLVFYRKRVC